MPDGPFEIARRGFEAWRAGRVDEAAALYERALAALPAGIGAPDLHGEYASVLTAAGRHAEAQAHYERALQLELEADADEGSTSVAVARYFLAEHFLALGSPDAAIAAVAPTIAAGAPVVALAHTVTALALLQQGREDAARDAAREALQRSGSDAQRAQLRARLAPVLQDEDPAVEP